MKNALQGLSAAVILLAVPAWAPTATLEVGPAKPFSRIENANAEARPGDTILVYPRPGNAPYEQVAILVSQPHLRFRSVPSRNGNGVPLSGQGVDLSGRGSTPRAIVQFDRGAHHCLLEGFELSGAHNDSHNAAGVRINQSHHVTIRNCNIHDNDMGIMSNGDGTSGTAMNQVIEHCVIHHNGSQQQPGFNHNLYLGGTSVTLKFCEVHHSLTGHNVKSRAHHTRVLYSYIHDSANREFDLVDSVDTAYPNSDAVLMGNIISKARNCAGNRSVLHFGQDGEREHDGTIYLIHNTIVTPYISPVLELSSAKANAVLTGNFVCDGGANQAGQTVAAGRSPGKAANVRGTHNWFGRGFAGPREAGLPISENSFGGHIASPFVNPSVHDFRPTKQFMESLPLGGPDVRQYPGGFASPEPPLAWQYVHPAGKQPRAAANRSTLGAYGE